MQTNLWAEIQSEEKFPSRRLYKEIQGEKMDVSLKNFFFKQCHTKKKVADVDGLLGGQIKYKG